MGYAGADWVENTYYYKNGKKKMSPFGREVADLLGDVFLGIYHITRDALRADFSGNFVDMTLTHRDLSTYDDDILTRLVLLSHDRCIRIEISPVNPQCLKLLFHKRVRNDESMMRRMPTIEDHIAYLRRVAYGEPKE